MKVATGTIVSVIAGYYFVEHDEQIYLCRGRGKLRKEGKPLTGDKIRFSFKVGEETGTVEEILPRRNQLQRPAVANVDAVIIVIAAESPEPDLLLLDKLLAFLVAQGLEALLCVNKADLNSARAAAWAALYGEIGFPAVTCSALTGQGLDELVHLIGAKTVVLAGQSGVGKTQLTAIIAAEQLDLPLRVGELSAKIGRGRHTTRQVTLLPLASGGKVADTPGFSVFDIELESRGLHRFFPEFHQFAQACYFSPCLHIHEPDCAVKAHLQKGEINTGRYENYLKIYQELKQKEADRY